MRCFVATFPSPESAERLTRMIPGALAVRGGVRPVATVNYHVTLKFLGERSAEEVTRLRAVVDELPLEPIDAHTTRYLDLPNRRRARVLALGVDSSGALETLAAEVARRTTWLRDLDDRPFVPHISLLRSRRPLRLGHLPALEPVSISLQPIGLYISTLSAEGARYDRA